MADTALGIQPTVIGSYWAHSASSEVIEVIIGGQPDARQRPRPIGAGDPARMITAAFQALSIPVGFDFASRNEHIQANPPGDEAANPADSRFAIRSYLAARA